MSNSTINWFLSTRVVVVPSMVGEEEEPSLLWVEPRVLWEEPSTLGEEPSV